MLKSRAEVLQVTEKLDPEVVCFVRQNYDDMSECPILMLCRLCTSKKIICLGTLLLFFYVERFSHYCSETKTKPKSRIAKSVVAYMWVTGESLYKVPQEEGRLVEFQLPVSDLVFAIR